MSDEYVVTSYRAQGGITHSYKIGSFEEIKKTIQSNTIPEKDFKKFAQAVHGLQIVLEDLEAISKENEEKMNKKPNIGRIESKLVVNKLCGENSK